MVERIVQWKKAYTDKDGLIHIPIKLKGKKKFKCDECGKKVREIFTINPNEILLRRELCRGCYCNTPESLDDLLECFDDNFSQAEADRNEMDERFSEGDNL